MEMEKRTSKLDVVKGVMVGLVWACVRAFLVLRCDVM